jgi:hypothetical protein
VLHCDESGTHVVGAVLVSPSSALVRRAENSCGDALVIRVVVQGRPERPSTQSSKSSA